MSDLYLAAEPEDFEERVAARVAEYAPNAYTIALHAPLTVPCAHCAARPGGHCASPNGWTPMGGFHAGRMRAVAHLDESARVRAYAEMKVRQEQRRANVQAELDALERDPAYVAQRNATRAQISAAWDEMNAQIRAEEREMRARCREPYVHSRDCRCREPGWVPPAPPVQPERGTAEVADLAAERTRRGRGASRSTPRSRTCGCAAASRTRLARTVRAARTPLRCCQTKGTQRRRTRCLLSGCERLPA